MHFVISINRTILTAEDLGATIESMTAISRAVLCCSGDSDIAMTEPNDEFDSPWKEIVEHYFAEFMAFFFPEAYADIDWSRGVEFLDKELQQVVRDAELGRRYADRLAKVWRLSGKEEWVLAHIEVQGAPEQSFDRRMYTYNYRLFDRYDRPVASFAVVNEDKARRHGQFGYVLWGCTINFEFPVVSLADYAAQWADLESSDNPFATVVMAHLKALETRHDAESRAFWKFSLIRRLYARGYARQDILNLFHFVDWLLRLPDNLEQRFKQQIEQLEVQTQMRYITSIERIAREEGRVEGREEGRVEGREEGREEGAARLLLRLLEHRFGELPETVIARVHQLSFTEAEALVDQALGAESLAAFTASLPE